LSVGYAAAATAAGAAAIGTDNTGAGASSAVVNSIVVGTALHSVNIAGWLKPQQATTVAAPAYIKGALYFDTTLNKLRVGGAAAWETVTSA
jgi:hypothetical protein